MGTYAEPSPPSGTHWPQMTLAPRVGGHERVDEARLADPGVAAEQYRRAPAATHCVEGLGQGGQLFVPSDEDSVAAADRHLAHRTDGVRRCRLSSIPMVAWRSVPTPAGRRPVNVAEQSSPLGVGMQGGEVVGDEGFGELEVVHASIVSR